MEADWEVEVGGEAPVIEARWTGLVDLQLSPQNAWLLPEAAQLPALAGTLIRLNAAGSPVWTSKCDLWLRVESGEFDADELDAPKESAAHAVACYIDLLPKSAEQWSTPGLAVEWCKTVCSRARGAAHRCCRVDLVVRQVIFNAERTDIGITAYLIACGPTPGDAGAALATALAVFADSIVPPAPAERPASKLQWKRVGE